jgi:DNA-binding protein Fis
MTLKQVERVLIAATLEHTEWNITRAAGMLGIERGTLYAKLSRYEIARHSSEAAST